MRLLLTGTNGLLGQKLVDEALKAQALSPTFDAIVATGRGPNRLSKKAGYQYHSMDITDQSEVAAVFQEVQPTHVIHAAAMTQVDDCEENQEACWQVNVKGTQHIAEATEKNGAHLLYVSTDFVFDGEDGPYSEEDQPNPISHYGHSKWEGEQLVQAIVSKWAIARTVLVYGVADDPSRSNIVLWAMNALRDQAPIRVVNDQFRTPTLSEDLARGCLAIAVRNKEGIYHLSGPDMHSVYGIVEEVAAFKGWSTDHVTPVASSTLNQPGKRPPKTGFVIDKAIKAWGYAPRSLKEGLAIVERQLGASNN